MLFKTHTSADFEPLYAIERACFEPPVRFTRRYLRSLLEKKSVVCWLVEVDGVASGFGVIERMRQGGESIAYIATLEVLPAHRRQGLGRELLIRLQASATEAGLASIWLHVDEHNAAAIELYRALGYTAQNRQVNFYPQGHAALVFARRFDMVESPACSGYPDETLSTETRA